MKVSDKTALELIISKLVKSYNARVKVTYGDVTSDKDVDAAEILKRIGNITKSYAQSYKLKKTAFLKVVHIIDTDGAFVPDSTIVFNDDADQTVYTDTSILTNKPQKISERNSRKSRNIEQLLSTHMIWTSIPYSIYYMSCNLDHALYNKRNSDDEVKECDAFAFANKYQNDIAAFLDFILHSDFSVTSDYKESWDFIKLGLNSLQRHTNLGLFFENFSDTL